MDDTGFFYAKGGGDNGFTMKSSSVIILSLLNEVPGKDILLLLISFAKLREIKWMKAHF